MRHHFPMLVSSMLVLCLAAPNLAATQEDSTLYVQVDCMKSRTYDYPGVESNIWKPIHAELVNQGRKLSWAFYGVLYGDRSECDYFTVNNYRGIEAVEDDLSDLQDIYKKVHPNGKFDEDMNKTWASREIVWSELWIRVDSVGPGEFKYLRVNQMAAHSGNEYVEMEREIYKPVHAALMEAGETGGWGLYSREAPWGTSSAYNYATVDFLKDLGAFPLGEYLEQVHPDADLDAIDERTTATRDLVSGSIWTLLDSTF